ncbi:diacylglycerol kinase family protein [Lacibacter luteus]|uniref:diacylglycerol kinase family protein n=1 Tax=Lacibacter luteus TaxID=2508719 RepID=UPI0013E9348A|nr:diacylglycerol kinase family protein [Lacibacter luteus]
MRSFYYAISGLMYALRREYNLRLHAGSAAAVCIAGLFLHISKTEWLLVVAAVAAVIAAELINTAIEVLCNHVTPEHHPAIKQVKDISAAAVLVVSGAAAITGAIIFIPKLFSL